MRIKWKKNISNKLFLFYFSLIAFMYAKKTQSFSKESDSIKLFREVRWRFADRLQSEAARQVIPLEVLALEERN